MFHALLRMLSMYMHFAILPSHSVSPGDIGLGATPTGLPAVPLNIFNVESGSVDFVLGRFCFGQYHLARQKTTSLIGLKLYFGYVHAVFIQKERTTF